jgi:hypothetical protein
VDCFAQILAASLTRLSLNNAYVCTLESNGVLYNDFGTQSYDAFGPNHGYPTLQSEDESFFESYYATPDSIFVAVARVNGTSNSGIGYYMTNSTTRVSYVLDDQGKLTSTLNAEQTYSPTERPWYIGALNSSSGSYVTATPYRFSLNTLRVTASRQCLVADKKRGVTELGAIAGADITLDVLSSAALTGAKCPLFSATNGVVFVVNADGVLLMQSGAAVPNVTQANATTGLVAAAARFAESRNGADWYGKRVAEVFSHDGEEYEVVTQPISASLTPSVDLAVWGWTVVSVQRASSLCGFSSSASALLPSLSLFL